mgnify:CR=1 FL=1
MGEPLSFSLADLKNLAILRGANEPPLRGEPLDQQLDEREWLNLYAAGNHAVPPRPHLTEGFDERVSALRHFLAGEFQSGVDAWERQQATPLTHMERLVYAFGLADRGDDAAVAADE